MSNMGYIPAGCLTCLPSAILCGTEPVCALTRALLYCCTLNFLFFFGILHCQWLSGANGVLTLNTNLQLPLFWSTLSRALGHLDSATCAGLAVGVIAIVGPRAKVQTVLGLCFSLNCRKYLKTRAHDPPDWAAR